MPRHPRTRDGRDGERDRAYDSDYDYDYHHPARGHRYRRDEDYDDDELEDSPRRERRYRRDDSGRRASRARGYESRGYESRDEYDLADRERERGKARRGPAAHDMSSRERDRRDRTRERERRARRKTDDEESPVRRKDRGSRTREAGREGRRERERERDGEAAARRARRKERDRDRDRGAVASKHQSGDSSNSASHLLSADALARLGARYDDEERVRTADEARAERKRRRKRPVVGDERPRKLAPFPGEMPRGQSKGRIVSGAYLEEGRSPEMEVRHRGGGGPAVEDRWRKEGDWDSSGDGDEGQPPFWKRKKWLIAVGVLILLLAIIVPVAVVVSKKKGDEPGSGQSGEDQPANSNLDKISRDSIPESAKGTELDPFTWYDSTGFNVTYTSETVGGLSVMGIDSKWDDSARPNDNVPPLNKPFPYGDQPIRGVNLGGWLSIEPFIVPSLFEHYSAHDDVIDEYTLCKKLGESAASRIERHYSTFIKEQDFAEIRDAGLDHVRIQFSYWAVTTYDGDPYVAKISWRYLLRAIEWARKYGLRVKLDPHALPGSQNGWNHSGREGSINWLQGPDGAENRKRSLEIHDKVSKFFAQPRYKNVVTIYGLVNEPFMLTLPVGDVLDWSKEAAELVQKNGIKAWIVVHDGFLNLSKWKKMLKDRPDHMLLDTHQYSIFNTGQIVLKHKERVKLICKDWFNMIKEINSTSEGWGPTMCGEWSQADTDCAQYLNNVGRGTRWEGTFSKTDSTQYCPTADSGPRCSCEQANADPSDYSDDYKKLLQTYAEAQMSAFETGQGWFYWTWHTESAAQWSYKTAWKNGFMPKKAYEPSFKCGDDMPDFGDLPDYY
ncbi:glycoside hydrolase [Aspergillus campestris IBT 28561]|uniref:glucan 1,3-beta-glucosidase n=1 Tax=Aspergillus campestris (strain IBT 28561) TaxID=1392248 RepID=A0A2I1CZG4_ASPC2|nr:glycoside hydrolase [Aspergillus campestris IBT 28561]PKY03019.1 glycoside hydrolase [Aspergillus campestris IBT 28561]